MPEDREALFSPQHRGTRALGSRVQGEGARGGAVLEGIIPAPSPPAGERKPSVGGLPCICLPLPPLPEIYNKKGTSFIF